MKRLMALFLACLMLFAVPSAVSAEESVTITVGAVKGEVGDIVQVPVTVSDDHYLVNGRVFLTYDPTVLELQNVTEDEDNPYFEDVNTAIFDSTFMWGFAVPAPGRANFVFATSANQGNQAGGVMYTLTFKLLKESRDTAITVTVPEMRSNNGATDFDTKPVLVDGTVTVKPYDPTPALRGDVNGDGKVDLSDAIRLLYYINGLAELTDKQMVNADLNGDGAIMLADATRLFYFAAGEIEL